MRLRKHRSDEGALDDRRRDRVQALTKNQECWQG
jgi:hypothetical protein